MTIRKPKRGKDSQKKTSVLVMARQKECNLKNKTKSRYMDDFI